MSFATKTNLLPHQPPAVAKLLPSRVGAMLMDMGTGKSRVLIELARLRATKWDKLIWLCPVSLKHTVLQQLQVHTDLPPEAIHLWTDRTSAQTLPQCARVHIVGIETLSASDRAVLAYNALVTPDSFVAVDESSYIKGHRSKRTQRITHMSERCRYRMVMTGTAISQGAVDLYAQMRFLSPKILGYRSFWSFAANHLEYEERRGPDGVKRRTGRIIRSHNEDYLAARIAPYTYQVRKDECLSLPDKLHERRWCELSDEQRARYEQAKQEILLELDYDDWSPIAIFHLYSALQGIVCGFWRRTCPRTGAKTLIEMETERLPLLLATLAEIPDGERVIIWAKYHHAVRQIVAALTARHGAGQVQQYHGKLGEDQREQQLREWRTGGRYLVATQSAGGHGLTLNEAAYVVFYADGFKYSERLQAEDRNHRIGQNRRPVYITLACSNSIDGRIAKALDAKGDALAEFQDMVNLYRAQGLKARALEMVRAL